jgi:hypothetical protein
MRDSMANRLAAKIALPAPTPPEKRVRVRRLQILSPLMLVALAVNQPVLP